jgi:hypothetical protein
MAARMADETPLPGVKIIPPEQVKSFVVTQAPKRVDFYRLHQKLLAEFAVEGLSALARFRDENPATWARLEAWRDRGEAEVLAEMDFVKMEKGERTKKLYAFAGCMAPYIRGGFINESEVRSRLEDCCETNGLIDADGKRSIERTITAALENSKSGLPDLSKLQDRPR